MVYILQSERRKISKKYRANCFFHLPDFADDYKEFMKLFWDKKLNDGKGGYRYDLVGYYFLLTQ